MLDAIVAAGDDLNRIGGEALISALQERGYQCLGHWPDPDGFRFEIFSSRTMHLAEVVLRVAMDMSGRGIQFLLKLPQTLAAVQIAAEVLGAELCLLGRTWYAVINPLSIDAVMDSIRRPDNDLHQLAAL